ncbi:MAG: hypothetical protein ACI90V_007682 [Bacillariaceae sp.]|jgi:hypothetical protein
MASSSDPLLTKEELRSKLYDAESIMTVKGSVANGYVVLLKGSPPTPEKKQSNNMKKKNKNKKKSNENNNNNNNIDNNNNDALAFMALTSGNVLDACFGVTSATRRNADITPACHRVNDAKNLLEDRDLTSDSFRRTAVAAYCDAFQVIIVHNEKMNKLNCITRCFKSSKIRRQTEEDLRIAFSPLITAIEESR